MPSFQHRVSVALLIAGIAMLCGRVGAQNATSETEIEDTIRDVREAIRQSGDIGAGYAAILNFAGNPDVSTATYHVDDNVSDEPVINVFRGSLRHAIKNENSRWKPFVQAIFPYETLRYGEDYGDGNQVSVEWEAYGIMGMFGAGYSVTENLVITPAINFGWLRLDNDARYEGFLAEEILEPAFDGLVYDWYADSIVAGFSLWADYQWQFEHFDTAFHGGFTYNHVKSIHSSSDHIEINSSATTLVANMETIHPTGINLEGFPVSVVFSGGGTAFVGPNRTALGFDSFLNAGMAFQADISRLGYAVRSVRLGGAIIFGENVTGWSFTFDYLF
tara:strand:- start:12870 stop:13865 length:996 start_codon:yes stop_codon:yes gene_type:complete